MGRWQALAMTSMAVVLTLSTWFSVTAVAPEISHALSLSLSQMSWLTNAVQGGFVIGALIASEQARLTDLVRQTAIKID